MSKRDKVVFTVWAIAISALIVFVVYKHMSSVPYNQGIAPMIISRQEWGAREPKERTNMSTPVDFVVIHHTYIPAACGDLEHCKEAMRQIQNYHMDNRGWWDIGYSFAIGGDHIFEGRGWQTVGAHAPSYNNHSIGIVFIGDYGVELPTAAMLSACKALIQFGVKSRYIQPDYQLIGHRQARVTECPGDKLFSLIQTWSHWVPLPIVATTTKTTINPTLTS